MVTCEAKADKQRCYIPGLVVQYHSKDICQLKGLAFLFVAELGGRAVFYTIFKHKR